MNNFSNLVQEEHFHIGGWIAGDRQKFAFLNGKLVISRKRWKIPPRLLWKLKLSSLDAPWRSLAISTVGYPSDSWDSCWWCDLLLSLPLQSYEVRNVGRRQVCLEVEVLPYSEWIREAARRHGQGSSCSNEWRKLDHTSALKQGDSLGFTITQLFPFLPQYTCYTFGRTDLFISYVSACSLSVQSPTTEHRWDSSRRRPIQFHCTSSCSAPILFPSRQ